jgi:MerR family transcriptional regulator, thiopeptide resistance regulator
MTQVSDEPKTWRIGELAEAAGLTVRTLHHYDQIGLLRPSRRGGSGHRLYAEADARRLYQIVALRGLGLSLGQVQECLTADLDPRPLIAEQVHRVSAQIDAATALRNRLLDMLDRVDHDDLSGPDLLELIRQTADLSRMLSSYLTDEQRATLSRHHEELGRRAAGITREELPNLYRQALAEYQNGSDPSSPGVQAIVDRIDRASATLSGGDESISGGVRRMWAERGDEIYPGSGIPWADLVNYLDRARTVAKGNQ